MSQNEAILDYLLKGNSITSLQALQQFLCFRLASRIADLKRMGYTIHSEMITLPSGKRVAQYTINGQLELL